MFVDGLTAADVRFADHRRLITAPVRTVFDPVRADESRSPLFIRSIAAAASAIPRPAVRIQAVIALVTANVIWGTTFVATKPMIERIPPLTIATGRFAVAVLVLLPVLWHLGRRPRLDRTAAQLGFTGVFLLYVTQNVGLEHTTASNGALIHGGIPVLTALLAVVFLRERLEPRRLAGILASMAGVAIVVLVGNSTQIGLSLLGDLLLLLSALALAGYLVIGRRVDPSQDPLALVAGVAIFGLAFLIPASGIEIAVRGMEQPAVGDIAGLVYLGAVASALAFVLWAFGLRHFEAGQAAAFANLTPIVGVAFAGLLLGEAISPIQIGGGTAILLGVWLATRPAALPAVHPPITPDGRCREHRFQPT